MEADIAPFRALLLGMFFMTVGFEIDLALCFSNLPLVASLVSRCRLPPCASSVRHACYQRFVASRSFLAFVSLRSLLPLLVVAAAAVVVVVVVCLWSCLKHDCAVVHRASTLGRASSRAFLGA